MHDRECVCVWFSRFFVDFLNLEYSFFLFDDINSCKGNCSNISRMYNTSDTSEKEKRGAGPLNTLNGWTFEPIINPMVPKAEKFGFKLLNFWEIDAYIDSRECKFDQCLFVLCFHCSSATKKSPFSWLLHCVSLCVPYVTSVFRCDAIVCAWSWYIHRGYIRIDMRFRYKSSME